MIIKDISENDIRLTDERKKHILRRPEMRNQMDKIAETLRNPEFAMESKFDKSVKLFYRLYPKTPVTRKYLLVAVKYLIGDAFIITAFFTDRVKEGELAWKS